MKKLAIYPGSFDPITNGHLDVLERSLKVFDEVIVLLAVNPAKASNFTVEERLEMIRGAVKHLPGVKVDYTSGLSVDYALKVGAPHLIRGLRAVTDFEYEFQLAAANRCIAPDVDEVFFMASEGKSFISSSTVNELQRHGVDISSLVPSSVVDAYKRKG